VLANKCVVSLADRLCLEAGCALAERWMCGVQWLRHQKFIFLKKLLCQCVGGNLDLARKLRGVPPLKKIDGVLYYRTLHTHYYRSQTIFPGACFFVYYCMGYTRITYEKGDKAIIVEVEKTELDYEEFMALIEVFINSSPYSKHEIESYVLDWAADIRASREN
jgi:hypothetical protein